MASSVHESVGRAVVSRMESITPLVRRESYAYPDPFSIIPIRRS
jgi:hypothetical protein